ncbi:MAG: hypothetical protein VW600_11380, partial [Ferrovibrio sp.]
MLFVPLREIAVSPSATRLPSRLRFWLLCIGIFMLLSAAVRLTLTVWIAGETPDSFPSFAMAWLVGLADDAATAVLLGLPFLAGLYLLHRVFRWKTGKALAHLLLIGLLGLAIFSAVAELFFWDEYNSRFNGIAVYYLIFPKEV